MLIYLVLWHTTGCYDGAGKLRMKSYTTIWGTGKVASTKRRLVDEAQHQIVHGATFAFHQIIDEAITSDLINMQKSACQIEAGCDKAAAHL